MHGSVVVKPEFVCRGGVLTVVRTWRGRKLVDIMATVNGFLRVVLNSNNCCLLFLVFRSCRHVAWVCSFPWSLHDSVPYGDTFGWKHFEHEVCFSISRVVTLVIKSAPFRCFWHTEVTQKSDREAEVATQFCWWQSVFICCVISHRFNQNSGLSKFEVFFRKCSEWKLEKYMNSIFFNALSNEKDLRSWKWLLATVDEI